MSILAEQDVNTQIGKAVRRLRRDKSMTVTELAAKSEVSSGMISRIENGQVSPSLTTLDAIARGLSVQLMSLFAHTSKSADVHFVSGKSGLESKRITPGHSHDYTLLGKHVDPSGSFESARVTIRRDEAAELPRYQHEGYVFLYIVSGEAQYVCGTEVFDLTAGASLSFDAKLQHGFTEIRSHAVSLITVSTKPV
ncbi:MAG: helix-turn-helix domain-containing protein [Boseongicola sp.]